MAITHVTAGAINDNLTTNVTTIPIDILAPMQVSDVIVVAAGFNTASGTITPPAGWTTLFPMIYTGSNHGSGLWAKVLVESDLNTQAVFTLSAGGRAHAVCEVMRGVAGLPTVMTRATDTVAGTTVDAPSVTTDSVDNQVLSFALVRSGVATTAFSLGTPGGGYTERAEGNTAFTTVPNFVASVATRDALSGPAQSVIAGASFAVTGATDSTGHTYTVALKPSTASASVPNSAFVTNVQTGPAPLTVQFTDSSTGAPTEWSWDFGDGEVSNDRSPVHTYQSPGSYLVSMTAKNASGSDPTPATGTVTVTDLGGRKMLKLRNSVWTQGNVLRITDDTWQ